MSDFPFGDYQILTIFRCKKRLKNLGHEAKDIEHVSYSLTLMIRQGHVHKLNPKGRGLACWL